MSVSTVQICSVNSKLAHLRWWKYQNPFLQAVVCACELKTALQAGHPRSISAYNQSNCEKKPVRLVKAASERTIRCCYSSHSSADETIDFLSSLQFEINTPFVCPDKDTPLDSVKAYFFNTLKYQNANTSNLSSTKLWKEEIKFNKRSKRKLYLE